MGFAAPSLAKLPTGLGSLALINNDFETIDLAPLAGTKLVNVHLQQNAKLEAIDLTRSRRTRRSSSSPAM